jgi:hypothetical protein
VREDSEIPGMIALAVAVMAVLLALMTMHIYGDRFTPKPIPLEKRTEQPDTSVEAAGSSIRAT